jgi:hypothetical protein
VDVRADPGPVLEQPNGVLVQADQPQVALLGPIDRIGLAQPVERRVGVGPELRIVDEVDEAGIGA